MLLTVLIVLACWSCALATAATFTVNSTTDAVDANPGNGVCETAPGNGICTLRAAIQEANALAGIDTIILPAGIYTLTRAGMAEDAAATGDLDITDSVDLRGAGATTTVVQACAITSPSTPCTGIDRVFHIDPNGTGINSTISGVTIQNGTTTVIPFVSSNGGGILLGVPQTSGSPVPSGHLTLIDCIVANNSSPRDGGGIANHAGTLTLIRTIVAGNAGGNGGGIVNGDTGIVDLTSSTLAGNFASQGGGIFSGSFDIGGSTHVVLTNSTVSGNTAGSGGGIFENRGTLTMTNVTVSGNMASGPGGSGGGIIAGSQSFSQPASANNVTIAGNSAGTSGSGGHGGGLSGSLTMMNSILAGNSTFGSGPDCSGSITSGGYNLIQSTSDCNISGSTGGNILGSDPMLGPLVDNGGPTKTQALISGSPAIGGGNPATPGSGGNSCALNDQRGFLRPQGPTCDIGAFERLEAAPTCTFNLSATSAMLAAAASSGSIDVSAASGCSWTAWVDPSAPWIKITSGASGSANGTVSFSVDANSGALSRTGVITIAGQSFIITQTGVTCFYSYSPTFQNFSSSGGSGSFNISAPPGCQWTVASSSPFIPTPSPTMGTGNGQVNYSAQSNQGASQRTGIITITGTGFVADFTVTESSAASGYACSATSIPSTVRIEGVAELVADVVLQCSGTSQGAVTGDLQVSLNTGVTSRTLDSAGNSEALLFINEPSVPNLGVNAFRGKVAGANAVVFRNVPLRPASGSQTMRITNLRVNASQLGTGAGAAPVPVTALIQLNALVAVPINGQQLTVANAQPSVAIHQGTATAGSDPSTQTVLLTFSEQFASAFKLAIASGQDPSQLGQTYNSESGFVNLARLGGVAGRADTGTRLRARITNIPGGTCVYAAVFATAGSAAQLVSADSNGAGGTLVSGVSIFGGTYQLLTCEPASTTGSATATWELTAPNPSLIETSSVTLLFQNAGSQISQIQIAASPGPVTQGKFAAGDSTVPVPRFKDSSVAIPVVNLRTATMISTPGSPSPPPGQARPHALAGGNLTFTDQIINDSSSTAPNVTVRSNLPSSLTLQLDVCGSLPPGAVAVCDNNGFTIVYPQLAAHGTINLTFSAQVGALVPQGTLLQVTTTAASDLPVFDPNNANATATFTVESSGCSPQISPTAPTQIPASGGSLSFQVSSCPPWTAAVDQLWLVLTTGSYFDTSSGTVMVQATANTGPARSANLRIADRTVTITQAGGSGVRDFAGNGRSGALLYDPNLGQSYTALSNGNGTYSYVGNLFSKGFDTLRSGDFNGDGKTDLILYNSKTAQAYIGSGTGDGTFNFQSLFWSPGYDFIEPGDLNGDGKTDFALYNSSTGTMYTAISNGTGAFTYKYTLISKSFTFVRLADFTGDGKADIFLYNKTNGAAFLGIGDGAAGFTFAPLFISPGYNVADIGDLNGDGKADVILYNSTTGSAATGLSNGAGGFTFTPMLFSPGFTSVRLADYTGDGYADVTVYNKTNAAAYFGTSTGLGTFNFQSLFWSPNYDSVEPQDVNGDGKIDVVLYNSLDGTEYTGISNGNGTFAYTYQYWGLGKVLAR